MRLSVRGWSLTELLLALAVLGVLAAVAIPNYSSYITKSRLAEAVAMSTAAKLALGEACSSGYLDGANNSRLALPEASAMQTSKVVSSIEATGLSATQARIQVRLKSFGSVQEGDFVQFNGVCSPAVGISWSVTGSRAEVTRLLP